MAIFRILGPIEVLSDESRVALGGPRQTALLTFLLLHANKAVSTDRLIDALWADQDAAGAVKRVQVAIGRLRKVLEDARPDGAQPMLRTVAGGYLLAVGSGELDAEVFRAHVQEARRALGEDEPARAAQLLREALALWRGPALAEVAYEPWAQADIALLEELRLSAIETRVDADLRLGRHAELVGELQALVATHPTRERLVSGLMRALYRAGRQAEALAVYRDARQRLLDELGLEPSPALRDLERAILAQDPDLDLPAQDVAPSPREPAEVIAELPGGTVTLLFTDIEGSTRLLQRLPDRYDELLADHHRLLRKAFEAHGGREIGTQGDGFFVAFRRARDAVAAAADAQRSLAAHEWPEGGPVRVRMGLHSGEPALSADSYVGLGVHRTARICAAGHGGQILLSNATCELVADQLPRGVAFSDLGEYRLKDIDRPERLYQVRIQDLPAEFPALNATPVDQEGRSPSGHVEGPARARLPVSATAIIGRDSEIAQVQDLLNDADTRLVTISGPGGVGKTRLAVESARGVEDRFADGVRYVALAAATAPDDVAAALARALPVVPAPGEALEDALGQHLAGRELLLILDNFEHVLEAAPLVADLLATAPRLTVLATSREPLRLRGERVFALAPLGLPISHESAAAAPAVALFLELAGSQGSAATPSSDDLRAAVDVCRRLDGLPLAIELAAGRLGLLSTVELARRLADAGIDALGTAARDAPARQRTLRSTLEWSYALLTEAEQTSLARLAVFVGDCTLDAAERVTGAQMETLEGLVAKHLVVAERSDKGSVRLRLLETVGTFARERLGERTDRDDAYRRHAEWFMALAEWIGRDLQRSGATDQLATLYADIDNLRAALDWALLHGEPETLTPERIGLLLELGFALSEMGELTRAEAIVQRAATGARMSGDPRLQWRGALEHAWVRVLKDGVLDEALDKAEEAVEHLTAAGDEEGLARAWQLIGMCRQARARGAAAQDALERALTHATKSGARHAETETLVWLLIVYAQGPLPAHEGIQRCTAVLRSSESPKVRAYALIERGVLAAMQGEFGTAREDVAAGRALLRELRLDVGAAVTSVETAIVELLADNAAGARGELVKARETLERMGERAFALSSLWALAEVACVEGDYREALDLSDRTKAMATDEDPHAQVSWRRVKALALAKVGELDTAERLAREAVRVAYATDSRVHRGDTSLALGTVLECAGRHEDATATYRQAEREFMAKGDIVSAARASGRVAVLAAG
jgi:predicted ATPase/class 3 adenylate cyclase/DNA-binding winged helix-turn-helix (wHTH) protein